MPDRSELSEAKLALLEKYLRGEVSQSIKDEFSSTGLAQESSTSLPPQEIGTSIVPIIAVQKGGSRPPFFYLHVHVEGGAFYCFTIAHYLGKDQPFYILEPCKYEFLPTPPTLETIAAAYIQSMQTVQPEGPYYVGGYCGGGLIAYEMARQLHAAGQEVAFVLLIDPKDGPAPHRMRFRNRLGNFVRGMGSLLRLSLAKQGEMYIFLEREYIYYWQVYDYLRIKFRRLQNSCGLGSAEHKELGRIWDKKGRAFPRYRDFGVTVEYIGPPSELWIGTFVWAISHYVARQYPGKIICLWAKHTFEAEQRKFYRQEEGQVSEATMLETYILPGDHMGLINEHLDDVARCLKKCLIQAQEAVLANEQK